MSKPAEKRKAEWDQMMKQSIYEATMTVLNENGFDGLRMDRVAKAARGGHRNPVQLLPG